MSRNSPQSRWKHFHNKIKVERYLQRTFSLPFHFWLQVSKHQNYRYQILPYESPRSELQSATIRNCFPDPHQSHQRPIFSRSVVLYCVITMLWKSLIVLLLCAGGAQSKLPTSHHSLLVKQRFQPGHDIKTLAAASHSPKSHSSTPVLTTGQSSAASEVLAGFVVSLATLPKAIAYSAVLGVNPLNGIWTSVIVSLFITSLGGCPGEKLICVLITTFLLLCVDIVAF